MTIDKGSAGSACVAEFIPGMCPRLPGRKSFAAWKEFFFGDSLRSSPLRGQCRRGRLPRRREDTMKTLSDNCGARSLLRLPILSLIPIFVLNSGSFL